MNFTKLDRLVAKIERECDRPVEEIQYAQPYGTHLDIVGEVNRLTTIALSRDDEQALAKLRPIRAMANRVSNKCYAG